MPTYETELLNRCVALELEAMTSIGVSADAKAWFFHTQGSFPYFTNRIAANSVTNDGSEVYDFNNPLVIVRFVVAHITEGYRGQPESKLYEWGPIIKTYIQRRMWLTSVAYPLRMNNLRQADVINNGGFGAFQDSGIGTIQVGREFQIQCIVDEYIEQIEY